MERFWTVKSGQLRASVNLGGFTTYYDQGEEVADDRVVRADVLVT